LATIEEAVNTRMLGFSALTSLVGTRIYPLVVPQDVAMPAVAYQKISGIPQRAHTGFSGLHQDRFQMTCEADDYATAKAVEVALRHCWDNYVGTQGGVKIEAAQVTNSVDGFSDVHAAPVVRMDVMIWHNAA